MKDKNPEESRILDIINPTIESQRKNNLKFHQNLDFCFNQSLTPSDIEALRLEGKSTFTWSTLSLLVAQQVKNGLSASPTTSVEASIDSDDERRKASALDAKIKQIYLENKYKDSIAMCLRFTLAAGMAVFKLKTDWVAPRSWEQKIFWESLQDPTLIFFDPSAKLMTKQDSEFVFEVIPIERKIIKEEYPNLTDDQISNDRINFDSENIKKKQTGKPKDSDIIYIVDFYENKRKYFFYYKLEDGDDYEGKTVRVNKPDLIAWENAEDDKLDERVLNVADLVEQSGRELRVGQYTLDGRYIVSKRKSCDEKIICTRLIGDHELEASKELNFPGMPFVFIPGDNLKIRGEDVYIPFIQNAIDAQRAKNFYGNFLLYEMVNNRTGTYMVAKGSVSDATMEDLKKPHQKNVIEYNAYGINNELLSPLPQPTYVQPGRIPVEYLQAFEIMGKSVSESMGAQFSNDMAKGQKSGTAVYNLTDFMTAPLEPFIQNLLVALTRVSELILGALPKLYQQESIKIKSGTDEYLHQLYYDYKEGDFSITIDRGVSFKLQQEATVDRMIKVAQYSPQFSEWLYSEGMPILFKNMPLCDNQEIIDSYEGFLKRKQQEAQQAAKNKGPGPDELNAQAKMLDVQIKAENLKIDKEKLNIEKEKVILGAAEIGGKLHAIHTESVVKLKKVNAENYRTKMEEANNKRKHALDVGNSLLKLVNNV